MRVVLSSRRPWSPLAVQDIVAEGKLVDPECARRTARASCDPHVDAGVGLVEDDKVGDAQRTGHGYKVAQLVRLALLRSTEGSEEK